MSTEAPMTMQPGACPDAELLASYMDGLLSPADRTSLERHLVDCADCRDIVGSGVPMASQPSATVTPFRPVPE